MLQEATILLGPGALAHPAPISAIHRAKSLCYLEAVRAVSLYCEPHLTPPPKEELLDLLDAAYDHMCAERGTFSPEDYSVYFLSVLFQCCDDEKEFSAIKAGARRYMADVSDKLSDDLARLATKQAPSAAPPALASDKEIARQPRTRRPSQDPPNSSKYTRTRRRRQVRHKTAWYMSPTLWGFVLTFALLIWVLRELALRIGGPGV